MVKYKPESIIKLNVGGTPFTTFYTTLAQSEFFVHLLDESTLSSKTITSNNEIFIDRSGKLFDDILYYLRTHSVFANDFDTLRLLQEEANYYQLEGMVEASEKEIKRLLEIDTEKTSFILKDADTLKERSNYIVLAEQADQFRVYEVLDVINVVKFCTYHGKLYCPGCNGIHSSQIIPKLLLYPTNKQLGYISRTND
ncbi:BTB/POZ protein [Mucor lusitanicus]|uniref:BTB/POZ protein n=1 Tax=Mucor circinelloides f. lusitanicus TaxID=29924 RepID=A0A8H4EX59_MUCCL|nr:BTB/POZ protein [Mucor lusitanicus]